MHNVSPEEIENLSLRFVCNYLSRFAHLRNFKADLRQEARIGVWVASERFDQSRGVEFVTYAWWWMRHQVNRFLHQQGAPVSIPNNVTATLIGCEVNEDTAGTAPCTEIETAITSHDAKNTEAGLIKFLCEITRARRTRSDAKCKPAAQIALTVACLKGATLEEAGALYGISRQAAEVIYNRNLTALRAASVAA